jgi:D-serine deaminase-like pyridoxal phosphate-dependent protein
VTNKYKHTGCDNQAIKKRILAFPANLHYTTPKFSMPMHFQQLDTPALLIDLDRLEANIARMAALAQSHGVKLRPHTKTHKCPEIAKMQIAAGAAGVTCAKLGEAEATAAAGVDDILIANQIIGEQKFKRLIELSKKAKVCVAVDSVFGAKSLNAALAQFNQTLDLVIEINCGQNRAGVLPGEEALNLAKEIAPFKQLKLRGLMTHGGHAYNQATREGIEKIGRAEGRVMVETAELLRSNGIPVETVSVGSTPTAQFCASVSGVTEIRPGTYVFYDLTQVDLFACRLEDCALTVLATVISCPASNRAVIDAGKKALTSDPRGRSGKDGGYGLILEKQVAITRLSEEHGVIESDAQFEIGEKVRILPNHACVVVNMFDEMYGIRDGQVERVFEITCRGKMT